MNLQLNKSRANKEEVKDKVSSFTQKAPVQTSTSQEPSKEEIQVSEAEQPNTEPKQVQQSKEEDSKYPWRDNTTMSEDELMMIKHKKSYDLPAELHLRLEFIKSKKRPKGFGQKITESSCVIDAIDEWTKKELKALGYSVK